MTSNPVSNLRAFGRIGTLCSSLLVLGLLNCSDSDDNNAGKGQGGSAGTGGASGGMTAAGGSTTGGTNAKGGSGAGGAQASGGSAQGGSPAAGGSTQTGSGGSTVIVGSSGGSTTVVGSGGSTMGAGGAVALCSPQPTSKGGIACPAGLCTVGTFSGYGFKYSDADGGKAGKSTICMAPDSLCAAGTTGAQDPPTYATWGAGIGFNLSPASSGTTATPVQLGGTGITVTFSSLPSPGGARVQMTVGGADYCANVLTPTATLLWSDFNTKCWNKAEAGAVALAGAPLTPKIQFQAVAGALAGTFDFCITALTIQ